MMKNHDTANSSIPKEVITYAAAHIEAKLAEIARNTLQPEQELREWVAIFLLSSWTGISDYMPTLRRSSSKTHPTTRKMAMAHNSHLKSPKKPSNSSHPVDRRTLSPNKGYKYPKGTHWTQKPENKAKLSAIRKAA